MTHPSYKTLGVSEHTPGPWEVHEDGDCIIAPNAPDAGDIICCAPDAEMSDMHWREANAAHIVRCVNSHDELLEALKGLLETCLGAGWSNEEYLERLTAGAFKHPDMVGPYAERVLVAREAIARAEARS